MKSLIKNKTIFHSSKRHGGSLKSTHKQGVYNISMIFAGYLREEFAAQSLYACFFNSKYWAYTKQCYEKWCVTQEVIKHDDVLWCFDYGMFHITIAQKVQRVARIVSFFKVFLHKPKQNLHEEKTLSHKKIKHSVFIRNSRKFIYVVFSVSVMCYKVSLHGMRGCAAKSL